MLIWTISWISSDELGKWLFYQMMDWSMTIIEIFYGKLWLLLRYLRYDSFLKIVCFIKKFHIFKLEFF